MYFSGSAWNESDEDFGNLSIGGWDYIGDVSPDFWPTVTDTLEGFFIDHHGNYYYSTAIVRVTDTGKIEYKYAGVLPDWENDMRRIFFSGIRYLK